MFKYLFLILLIFIPKNQNSMWSCKFIVGGRKESTGRFETLSNILSPSQNGINLPDSLKTMFAGIEENDFRFDISSTQLREQIVSCDSNSNSNSNSNSDNSKSWV